MGLYSHYDGAHNHPVNRALHMIAIPIGFSSIVVVWFHWVIGLLLIPAAFALAAGTSDRRKRACVLDQSRACVRGPGLVGAQDLRSGREEVSLGAF